MLPVILYKFLSCSFPPSFLAQLSLSLSLLIVHPLSLFPPSVPFLLSSLLQISFLPNPPFLCFLPAFLTDLPFPNLSLASVSFFSSNSPFFLPFPSPPSIRPPSLLFSFLYVRLFLPSVSFTLSLLSSFSSSRTFPFLFSFSPPYLLFPFSSPSYSDSICMLDGVYLIHLIHTNTPSGTRRNTPLMGL